VRLTQGLYKKLLQICPEGVIGNDRKGNIFVFNESAERLLGYTQGEVLGKLNVASLYPAGVARGIKAKISSEEFGGRGQLIGFETEVLHKDGRKIPIRLSCAMILEDGKEVGVIGFFSDISARKALERQFRESEEQFRGIVETASDAIISFDADRTIVMTNLAAEELLGYHRDELAGLSFQQLIPSKYGTTWEQFEHYAAFGSPLSAKGHAELSLLHVTGKEIPVQLAMAEKESSGKRIVTAIIRDISARKALEEELRIQSITDHLTRLYNRRHFHSLAQKEMDRSRRTKSPFSLFLIDIDGFKAINDTYGHTAGDMALQIVAAQMMKNFRTMDSCFRYGGEEFMALLPETDSAGAMVAAERLRNRISETDFLPVPGDKPVRLTVSIGISEYHEDCTLDDLVRFADLAMYAAKNAGRNRSISYDYIRTRLIHHPLTGETS